MPLPQQEEEEEESSSGGGVKALVRSFKSLGSPKYCTETAAGDEIISDRELAHRKAEEAAARRYQATEWLRHMDGGGSLSKHPSEEEFRLSLRNGLILCNVLNKVNPGAVHKVVESPIVAVQSAEGPAQSAIQYFENMRNFLVAVKKMELLTFEASDMEKGGSSSKVVDCILCLKGYYEWKLAGGIGVWRYGGLVKITSCPKESPASLLGSESADESFDESESSQFEQLLEFPNFSNEVSVEESTITNVLAFLFDYSGLGLLQAYIRERNGIDDFPLNATVIDTLLSKVVKEFSTLLISQGTQLGLLLKKMVKGGDIDYMSKEELIEAISQYLRHKTNLVSCDFSKFCICRGQKHSLVHTRTSSESSYRSETTDLHQKELHELRLRYNVTRREVMQMQADWREELSQLVLHIKSLEVASLSYHTVLEENRELYNQVQDLKGSIRVYCRVRPFLSGQINGQSTVDYIGENGNLMIVHPHKQGKDARKVFNFNKVFATSCTQEQIYGDTQPLIRSVLDGYNVCIFAYGQTGSGKTYTMSGPDLNTKETWGVNYRALRDLFQITKKRADVINYQVGVQMIEIYNEQVRDLLVSDGFNRKLDIRNNSQLNGLNVPDASLIRVSSTRDVLDLMRIGQRNRAVGATALNERSSRSHSILTVHAYGKELISGSILKGCLHLVDLAGSERVDKSEAVGERLKEAQHINRSLSALGDVIYALAQKSHHVPYRNSKLTQVLQNSLGGQAKTLMFVHINPDANAIGETISTLKFAERVASIELGAAKANKEIGEIRDLKEEISSLKQNLETKEAELEQLKRESSGRNATDVQRTRAVSPYYLPRHGTNTNLKSEIVQRENANDETVQSRGCSSDKQRRSRFPLAAADKEALPKLPFDERSRSSTKQSSPSPPVRRSISTDRGALIRNMTKPETVEINTSVGRAPFLGRAAAFIKSVAPTENKSNATDLGLQEAVKHDSISSAFYNFQKSSIIARKPLPKQEEEQFKQALNIRQGGIQKFKNEVKIKSKQKIPARLPKFEEGMNMMLLSETNASKKQDEPRRNDFSEPEKELMMADSPLLDSLNVKKLQRNLSKNSQNLEARGLRNEKGGNVATSAPAVTPELRRSRSTPRGKFFVFP